MKVKHMFAFVPVVTLASFVWASPLAETKIENTGPTQKVILSDKLAAALNKYDPKFRILREKDFSNDAKDLFPAGSGETPMAVSGDFNGDTFPDFAFFGKSQNRYVVLMAVGEGTSWNIQKVREFKTDEVGSSKKGLNVYLSLLDASDLSFAKDSKLKKRDAVQVEFFRGDTRAYYFDEKSVQEYKGHPL